MNLEEAYSIVFEDIAHHLSEEDLQTLQKSYDFLTEFSVGKVIYGINTGLGPMAQYRIENEELQQLQYNLIRSHSAGAGNAIPTECTKAAMLVRLVNFCLGYSGIHPEVAKLLSTFINKNIYPYIPEHGGVGASGDLVQLSHLALTLIGEGKVLYQGKWQPTAEVMSDLNIQPIKMHLREGLGLINGTSVMTGIGIVNYFYAIRVLGWSVLASSLLNEIVETYDDHFSSNLNKAKEHPGQNIVAQLLGDILSSSQRVKKRDRELYNKDNGHLEKITFEKKVQEYYSLRCIPQIVGPIYDTIQQTGRVLENELNSACDNPIVDTKAGNVFHGGNFHGDYISLEMDKLRLVVTKLTMLMERQLNYLLNPALNGVLPPFVNLGKLGLNLGMQGAQFTATSTTAENQTLSNPMYVHSIPNNNDNQDIVSMGTNAALLTYKTLQNSFQVLSIHLITMAQAIDYIGCQQQLSEKTTGLYNMIRSIVPTFSEDYPVYEPIEKLTNYLKAHPSSIHSELLRNR